VAVVAVLEEAVLAGLLTRKEPQVQLTLEVVEVVQAVLLPATLAEQVALVLLSLDHSTLSLQLRVLLL
jgi:hypothetical protein